MRHAKQNPAKYPWLTQLLARRPFKVGGWRSPTRWRAPPGRCWSTAAPIGRRSLLKLPKRGSARKKSGGYVSAFTNCRGDEDIDAKRSRPSIGKPVLGHCEERARAFVWDRSADHIRASSLTAAFKGRIHGCTRTLRYTSDSSCNAGTVHTWPLAPDHVLMADGRYRS